MKEDLRKVWALVLGLDMAPYSQKIRKRPVREAIGSKNVASIHRHEQQSAAKIKFQFTRERNKEHKGQKKQTDTYLNSKFCLTHRFVRQVILAQILHYVHLPLIAGTICESLLLGGARLQ